MFPILLAIAAVFALEKERQRPVVDTERKKLADIYFCAMEMMKLAREAEAEGIQPHEVMRFKRKARETLDYYYQSVDTYLGFEKARA